MKLDMAEHDQIKKAPHFVSISQYQQTSLFFDRRFQNPTSAELSSLSSVDPQRSEQHPRYIEIKYENTVR